MPAVTFLLLAAGDGMAQFKKKMTPTQDIHATLKLTPTAEQITVELTVDSYARNDVYITDVAFQSTDEGVKIDRQHLPVRLGKDNVLLLDLSIKPPNPNTLWAIPPSFYAHKLTPGKRYVRQWRIAYPVQIPADSNQGMARLVPVGQDVTMTVGIVAPPAGKDPQPVDIDGETVYKFLFDSLAYQRQVSASLHSQQIRLRVVD